MSMKRPGLNTILSLLCLTANIWVVYSLGKQSCKDVDKTRKCLLWKNLGYCENENEFEPYMNEMCNHTCGLCDNNQHRPCPRGYFSCLDGLPRCVPVMNMCDCKDDCENGHDEEDCSWMVCDEANVTVKVIPFGNLTEAPLIKPPDDNHTNGDTDIIVIETVDKPTELPKFPGQAHNGIYCPAEQTACTSNQKCISIFSWCDGWIKDCPDGEDETDLCYKPVNREAFKKMSVNARISVSGFFEAIQRMKHTHCTTRVFSCKDSCMDDVNLYSYECACDKECWQRNDCCHDIVEHCPTHLRPKGVIERCSPNLFGKGEDLSALVIDQCPESATVHDAARCGVRDKPDNVKYYGSPVYSPEEEKHYRNYYCAKCNGAAADNLVPWNVWFGCQSTENDFDEDCDSLIFIPPLNYPPRTCRVKNFQDPSFEDTVITTQQKEGKAAERCQTVYAPVKYNETLYRNPYCVYLHRYQVGDRNMTRLYTCDIDSELGPCEEGTAPCRPTFACMPDSAVCNGIEDCSDRSDEPETCTAKFCYPDFRCKRTQHQCYPQTKVCDGFLDCDDESDEAECEDDVDVKEIVYRNNFHEIESLSRLSKYPRISNSYYPGIPNSYDPSEPETSAVTKKSPKCIEPLHFDGINCKYNGSITRNKKYEEVYLKQDVTTIAYNITLSPLGYHRPKAMSDDPVEFLTKHLQHHPYQVVDFKMDNVEPGEIRKAQLAIRHPTKLEESRGVQELGRTKRYADNYLQIGTEVYQITAKLVQSDIKIKELNTLIVCQFDSSGPIVQVLCTGCAYVEYTYREYTITSTGSIQLKDSDQVLNYQNYELRANGTILVCWDTPNTNSTDSDTKADNRDKWMKVWFGVGYSLALMVHLVAINMNLLYGRKTTLRIFFINFTTMGVIWSFDALLSTVSSVYSIHGQSLHLYGNLGTLAWLLIISFHLLLSVSDGSPAVYFSVDNLVYYHVCGWLLPLGWVLLFFLLSTLKVVENVVCLTDSRQSLQLNQISEILHFPIWVLIVVVFFLLLIVIGTTKRLMAGKSGKVDLEVMGCRLQIKMMVFVLFLLQAFPWTISLCLKYIAKDFMYHNAVFCLSCVMEGFYLIYILKALVDGNLEKLRNDSASHDSLQKIAPSPNSELSHTPDMKPALPPKMTRGPRPPLYQRPIDHNYTPFPSRDRMFYPQQDQYSHLQGGNLGGNRNGKKKDYYPVTKLGSPAYTGSRKGSLPNQDQHQYMPLKRSELNHSPSQSTAEARSRQRTTSSQGFTVVSNEPGYQPVTPTDKGKHRVPRSAHPSDQSNSPSAQLTGGELNDNPPPYRLSEADYAETQACSSNEVHSLSTPNLNQVSNNLQGPPPVYNQSSTEFTPEGGSVDTFKSSYC